jgi:alpha-glucosidase
VVEKGATSVQVYFPEGAQWVDLWTGADAGTAGEWVRMPAPLGKPAVFLRKGAESFDDIIGGLRGVNVLDRQN